jgi:TetR/AcrR family transcriptional regulator
MSQIWVLAGLYPAMPSTRALNKLTPDARKYPQLPNGMHALDKDTVVKNQRARIGAAMLELIATNGYKATTVEDVATLAGVSIHTFYELYAGKEACYLVLLDAITARVTSAVNEAYRAESDWSEQLHSGLRVFIREVVQRPGAARLALVEVLGATPAALGQMEAASRRFETMVSTSFAASPDRVALPAPIVSGIVGGLARVARQRIVERRLGALSDSTDELFAWMLSYHSPAAAKLKPSRTREQGDEWIVRDPRLTLESFHDALRRGGTQQLLTAYDTLGTEVATRAARDAREAAGGWPERVRAGLLSILQRIASDAVFARLAFVDVFSVGPAGIATRSRLMHRFSDLLLDEAPPAVRPSELVAEAIAGAVWQIAADLVWRGATERVPELADYATYLVLAPTLGAEQAIRHIRR